MKNRREESIICILVYRKFLLVFIEKGYNFCYFFYLERFWGGGVLFKILNNVIYSVVLAIKF